MLLARQPACRTTQHVRALPFELPAVPEDDHNVLRHHRVGVGVAVGLDRHTPGEIVRHGKGDKIVVFKMKRRKNYAKKQGHRQGFTEVRINEISLG